MTLNSLPFRALVLPLGARDIELHITYNQAPVSITSNSVELKPGDLFACMPSRSRDTHEFLPQVKKQGGVAAIVHSQAGLDQARAIDLDCWLVEPTGSRFNFIIGRLCRTLLSDPSDQMRVIGVTGTNGKTTTAWMIRHALGHLGRQAAYLGTLGFFSGDRQRELNNTTPYPVDLWNLIKEAYQDGNQDIVMEASSHALFERRLAGVQFDVGIFTNLTQDHLDFHGTMEEYSAAKKLLFTEYAASSFKSFLGVINSGHPVGRGWAHELPCRVLTFGEPNSDLTTQVNQVKVDSLELTCSYQGEAVDVKLKFGGLFNVENAASSIACLLGLGYPLVDATVALSKVEPVPGRFEPIQNEKGIGVLVDYAHTPDALEQLLKSVRAIDHGRIITVFGCGGDRDRGKRPLMAQVVSRWSDLAIVTSDNPRTENPDEIIADISVGLSAKTPHVAIPERRAAIAHAINEAKPGDIVVIAGKGHEDYQIIGRTKYPMDDRVMAREALKERA